MKKENKKYEFTNDTIKVWGSTLYRIRALRDFGNVKAGDLGGYIEKESNLSHEGDCWVADKAWVCENAIVSGNAQVFGYAWISGNAQVCGGACVYCGVRVYDDAKICGNAKICGDARICGSSYIDQDTRTGSQEE